MDKETAELFRNTLSDCVNALMAMEAIILKTMEETNMNQQSTDQQSIHEIVKQAIASLEARIGGIEARIGELETAMPAVSYERLEEHIDYERLADLVDPETVAGFIDAGIDAEDVAAYIDTEEVADYIPLPDIAAHIDIDSAVREVLRNL